LNLQTILGIESAIEGGSISLHAGGSEIAAWVGERSISRAEDLLPNIDRLLRQASISVGELNSIVVSVGPGSFTGIKIGLATALGLRAATGIDCVGISSLAALSLLSTHERVIVALPVGRGSLCIQSFDRRGVINPPELIDTDQLGTIHSDENSQLVLHGSIADEARFPGAIDAGFNIANRLCNAVDSRFATHDLAPLFIERNLGNIR
jgi:tRNA threonylcarbamoyl adenosine modification protein YeaZ